jgi:hypothetical protein
MGPSALEWIIYTVVAILAIVGIIYCLCNKMAAQEEESNWQRIR